MTDTWQTRSNHFGTLLDTVNIPTGAAVEHWLGKFKLLGPVLAPPTTASNIKTTATADHDFNINLNQTGIYVDGTPLNIDAAADVDLSSSASASLLAIGEGIIYCLVAHKSPGDGLVRTGWVAGTIALTAAVVRPTKAAIQAALGLPATNVFFVLGETRLDCSAAEVLSQTINNLTAPAMIPDQQIPSL